MKTMRFEPQIREEKNKYYTRIGNFIAKIDNEGIITEIYRIDNPDEQYKTIFPLNIQTARMREQRGTFKQCLMKLPKRYVIEVAEKWETGPDNFEHKDIDRHITFETDDIVRFVNRIIVYLYTDLETPLFSRTVWVNGVDWTPLLEKFHIERGVCDE